MRAILIVRLGSLGDIIHAIPVAAALRARFPEAHIDWVVDERHTAVLDLVPIVDRRIPFLTVSASLRRRIIELRRTFAAARYDVAVDVQGLLKSAVVARLSGAPRVLGFSSRHLRERAAGLFYTDQTDPVDAVHVVHKNLALAGALGADVSEIRFPLVIAESPVADAVCERLPAAGRRFAVLNPGAGWANKRWPPARFAAVAQWLRRTCGLRSVVTWGPGQQALALSVVAGTGGAAELAPPTSLVDLAALLQRAALVVSGDTGPAHLAAAVGTPVVGVYGPTDPARNGPWSSDDVTVSRYPVCGCRYRRRCRAARACLAEIAIEEVTAAITRRIGVGGA